MASASAEKLAARHNEEVRAAKAAPAGIGHNSEPAVARFAKDQLASFVERIERLDEEKKGLADDIRDIYAEAKGAGFDVKALRTIIRMRKRDAAERAEQQAIVDTYAVALGMLL